MLKIVNDLQFGEFTLERHARELRRQGELQPVSGKAFNLLAYMAANAGRPLSKAELLDAVWPETTVEESNLSQNVFLLRKVLGSDGPIKTLAGRGYQFAAQVTELESGADSSFTAAASTDANSVTLEATHARMVVEDEVEERIVANWRPVLATLLVVVVVLSGALLFYRQARKRAVIQAGDWLVSAGVAARPAVAVLGFRDFSNHPEGAWLSTAVAEMLASEINTGDKLRVIPSE